MSSTFDSVAKPWECDYPNCVEPRCPSLPDQKQYVAWKVCDPRCLDDSTGMVELDLLPEEHQLRNTPLGEIGAEYRNVRSNNWLKVEPGRALGLRTFNTLEGGDWTNFCKWRVPAPKETT